MYKVFFFLVMNLYDVFEIVFCLYIFYIFQKFEILPTVAVISLLPAPRSFWLYQKVILY